MASDGVQDAVEQLLDLQLFTLVQYALTALTFFDFVLTLPDERNFIWKPKKNLVFFIFICIRYANLGSVAANVLSNVLPLQDIMGCTVVIYIADILATIASAGILTLFAFRSFAMWDQSRMILAVLSAIAIAKLSFDIAVDFFYTDIEMLSGLGRKYTVCLPGMSDSPIGAKLASATAALLFLFDTLVLGLISAKTIRLIFGQIHGHTISGYLRVIFCDGILFYLAIEILVISSAVFDQTESLGIIGQVSQIIQPPLSAILAQRLVLSLKQVYGDNSKPSHYSTSGSKAQSC